MAAFVRRLHVLHQRSAQIRANSPYTRLLASFRCHQLVGRGLSSEASPAAQTEEEVGLADSCVKQLTKIDNGNSYLRILVEGGGCSGFQYKFNLDTEVTEDDKVFERAGAKLVVDKESLEFLKGSVIEYHEELIRAAFQVQSNPQAEQGCSCGASFSVKL